MLELTFQKALTERDVRDIRASVQKEASQRGLGPQQGFVLLFVVDELCCNVMEHGKARWVDLKVEASAAGFRMTLHDDGVPFNTATHTVDAMNEDLKLQNDRRVGLTLVGRLVDELKYQRTDEGFNKVELIRTF